MELVSEACIPFFQVSGLWKNDIADFVQEFQVVGERIAAAPGRRHASAYVLGSPV
jgi:hypothetical protein